MSMQHSKIFRLSHLDASKGVDLSHKQSLEDFSKRGEGGLQGQKGVHHIGGSEEFSGDE